MNAPADRSGAVLGDYTLQRLLGRGAMGEVYEARDERRGRSVALKLLAQQYAGDEVFRERFLRESRMAAQLNDPHVIPIHDWGEIDGLLFLDMRIVSGGTDLRHLLAGGPLAPERAVSIIEQVAQALDAAHAAGLVHRDVKPDNVLIDSGDFAYLVDFGLAQTTTDPRLTDTGAAVGSFAYMAPERFGAGNIATPATDIYALTCVLVECLTAAAPFGAGDLQILVAAHLHTPPPVLGGPFDYVIACGMAKNPADRYVTAGQLALAARNALEGRVPVTPPLTPTGPPLPALMPTAPPHLAPPMQALPPITYIPPVAPPPVAAPPMNPTPLPYRQSQPGSDPSAAPVAIIVGAIVFLLVIVLLVAVLVATLS